MAPARKCMSGLAAVVVRAGIITRGHADGLWHHASCADRQLDANQPFNIANIALFIRRCERYRFAVLSCSGGPSDAVHIIVRRAGQIKINDHFDVADVNAAGGDVCGYQDAMLAGFESDKRMLALG